MATVIYRGTDGNNKYEAQGDVLSEGTVVMYGNGGSDHLVGSFWHDRSEIYGGTGSDSLEGGANENLIYGGSGDDEITVFWTISSVDTLYGGSGRDILSGSGYMDGGTGADTMSGYDGADVYVVDNIRDRTLEEYQPYFDNEPNPRDTVRSSISWTLAVLLEDLVLTGTNASNGTGNGASNHITGNDAGNVLSGLNGSDTLLGGRGWDKLLAGNGKDKLDGGLGRDILVGGTDSGADSFVFSSYKDSAVGANHDRIVNFSRGADHLDLRNIDADLSTAANQAFDWSGSKAAAHSVWWKGATDGVLVRADVNGDARADFELLLLDKGALGSADVLL